MPCQASFAKQSKTILCSGTYLKLALMQHKAAFISCEDCSWLGCKASAAQEQRPCACHRLLTPLGPCACTRSSRQMLSLGPVPAGDLHQHLCRQPARHCCSGGRAQGPVDSLRARVRAAAHVLSRRAGAPCCPGCSRQRPGPSRGVLTCPVTTLSLAPLPSSGL